MLCVCQVYNMRTSEGVKGPVSPTHRFSPAKSYHEVLNGGLGQLQLVCSMLVVHPDAQSVVPPDLTLQLQETITPLNNTSAARRQEILPPGETYWFCSSNEQIEEGGLPNAIWTNNSNCREVHTLTM